MNDDCSILNALEQQLGCYQKLAKLAELQHEHVQRNFTEGLLDVLGLRQEVLTELATHETLVASVRKAWPEFLEALPAEDRARAEASMGETRRLLEEIVAADRQDAIVLQHRKHSLGQQIYQTQAARKMNRNIAKSAYGKNESTLNVTR